MAILRKNTSYGITDISPRLQDTLNANGMQAHITMSQTGDYELVTLSPYHITLPSPDVIHSTSNRWRT